MATCNMQRTNSTDKQTNFEQAWSIFGTNNKKYTVLLTKLVLWHTNQNINIKPRDTC